MENNEFKNYLEATNEVGYVVHCSDSLVYLSGLPSLRIGEEVISENGERGMVYGLDRKKAEILMFEMKRVEAGHKMVRTGDLFKIPVSEKILGRVINPLCRPLDKAGSIMGKKKLLPIQQKAPGIMQRIRISEPLETGVTMVDLLVPIGYGQRETVIGDAKTGKTFFLFQTMVNQARKGAVCIYVAIGKESSSLKKGEDYLKEMGVFDRTIMIITTSNQPATLHYIAPFAGMTIAEYFRDQGNKVIIVFDDLTTHAKAYREISLLLKRSPGREAYPGDIFSLHAMLIERAGFIKISENKEASITAFPVAETLENNISGFIQTNLLAMTDGHIFFDIDEFKKGKMPAVNAFLSVSRAGNQTRQMLDKALVGRIRSKLTDYRRVLEVSQFGSELSKENRLTLELGKKIEVLLSQNIKTLMPRPLQLLLFGLLFTGFWEEISPNVIEQEIVKIEKLLQKNDFLNLVESIEKMEKLEDLTEFCRKISPSLEKFL